eukprot:CAMPEP_0197028160 /NCGR_PEP_ID=MMETSP1384-20130603/7914_1 /TAXON_ID=29189 /ORGANISM="Ammonia sp." /LENGTH=440 /DNA_ID=CAMNT_0042457119 /DNA_START=1995 /DNA_END=3317 /DNA_ORIENTATION=+
MSHKRASHKNKRPFNEWNKKHHPNNAHNGNDVNPHSSPKRRKFNHQHDRKHEHRNHRQTHSSAQPQPQQAEQPQDIVSLIKRNQPRSWTVSVAIAGSVMDTASTPQLQTYLASQFARILSIFCVDEIVVFSESGTVEKEEAFKSDPNLFFVRLLKYLETPQYLRRLLFPHHTDFRYVGICRPLRTPHHLGRNELSAYREGIVLKHTLIHPKQVKKPRSKTDEEAASKHAHHKKLPKFLQRMQQHADSESEQNVVSVVNIGLNQQCIIDRKLDENTRITVHLDDYTQQAQHEGDKHGNYYFGEVVEPTVPMQREGIYWGYKTRFAADIGEVVTRSMYADGYDVVIGTSDKGKDIYDEKAPFKIAKFKHLLIVFGGPNGLESCVFRPHGAETQERKLLKPELLFDEYINVCPYQGTRTIRSEEALLMTLSVLQPHIQHNYRL